MTNAPTLPSAGDERESHEHYELYEAADWNEDQSTLPQDPVKETLFKQDEQETANA